MALVLNEGWKVFQDVQGMGEVMQVWMPSFKATDSFFHCMSDWEPIDRLTHLQLLFSSSPYSGRDLRHFNAAPWWYKKEFIVDEKDFGKAARLRFEAIDYFARVYLNGTLLGEHEGYFSPAEFDVGDKLKLNEPNTLVVKVWSPFDDKLVSMKQHGMNVGPMFRFLASNKEMMKGTYDHADGFFQRDVNPVGIYGDVSIEFYKNAVFAGEPNIQTSLSEQNSDVDVSFPLAARAGGDVRFSVSVLHPLTDAEIVTFEDVAHLKEGLNDVSVSFKIEKPLLWTLWDRGTPNLYTLRIRLLNEPSDNGELVRRFGVRSVLKTCNINTTAFALNGETVFLRGTSYFPDVYISRMTPERYESDLLRMKSLGFNAVRVHVHVARESFYACCDKLGMAVIQDSDLSWFHSDSDSFTERAVSVYTDMIKLLRYHPSIICWIVMNEPDMWRVAEKRGWLQLDEKPNSMMDDKPGPQLVSVLNKLDPARPYIKGSQFADDAESGDTHDYTGSITGENTHYFDNYGKRFKLLSEYGMDMPGSAENLHTMTKYFNRIKAIYNDKTSYRDLCEYRKRYLKYLTEYCRIQKHSPCSGYFQFLFSDVAPQSFYGLADWWGVLKCDADYCMESNMPLGAFLEFNAEKTVAIWAVNDTPKELKNCRVVWSVTNEHGELLFNDCCVATLPRDGSVKIGCPLLKVTDSIKYNIRIAVMSSDGSLLAENRYEDIFKKNAHPAGHPMRIDHELGMRLYWA